VQLHLLVSYPPSNLNRDDTGRPKSAIVGDANRLRISSQSLKRAWRTSDEFRQLLPNEGDGVLGSRTKRIGLDWIYSELVAADVDEQDARKWSREILKAYGAPDGDKDDGSEEALKSGQLVHVSPAEQEKLRAFVADLAHFVKTGQKSEMVDEA